MIPEPLPLRTYQVAILDQINHLLAESNSLLSTSPTGSGKTVMLAEIMSRVLRKNLLTALLVHRQELVKQSEAALLQQSGHQPGVVWQERKEWDNQLLILAQDTISASPIPDLPPLHLLVIDEAHHTAAPGWLHTIQRLNPKYLLGFSATPFRQDKEPLSPFPFANVIRPITPQELIDQGHLCPAIIESPIIHDRNGQPQPINQANNLDQIYRQAVSYAIANGRSKIILYVSGSREFSPLEIITKTTNTLRNNGITADPISQDIPPKQREATIQRFKATPEPSVLVNYMALTEGTDLPLVDCVIIGRHTTSESTIIQMIGRGLRKHPLKENCLVIQYTNRTDMSDIIHYWRIDQAKEEGAYLPKQKNNTLNKASLIELIAKFPKSLSPLDNARAQYPWFRPYNDRPLLALSIWAQRDQSQAYIAVEPSKNGMWKVSKLTLNKSGPAPLNRQQTVVADSENAAILVRMALGEHAPLIERGAPWRLRPASEPQKKAWKQLYPDIPQSNNITSGEVSDAIAKKRFQIRVNPTLL